MTHELARTLLTLTLASSAAILVALLIRRSVRRVFGAARAYFAWLLVPVTLVAALLPNAPTSLPAIPVSLDIVRLMALGSAVDASLATVEQARLDPQVAIDWAAWLLGAWLAGTVLMLAYFAGAQRAFLKSLGALSNFGALPEWRRVLRAEHPEGCPALVGVFRPKLILPADFESRYTEREQMLVLAHEQMHLRRGDAIWNAAAALMRCLFWFNPLVHIAASRLRVDQELACDAAVIQRHPDSLRTYAGAMMKTQLADTALPAGCHWRSAHPLKERLMTLKQPAPSRARRACGTAFITSVLLVGGYSTWAAAPEDVPGAQNVPERQAEPPRGSSEQPPARPAANGDITVQADRFTVSDGKQTLIGNVLVKWTNAAGEETVVTSDRASGEAALAKWPGAGVWTFEGKVHSLRGARSLRSDRMVLQLNGTMILYGKTAIDLPPRAEPGH